MCKKYVHIYKTQEGWVVGVKSHQKNTHENGRKNKV